MKITDITATVANCIRELDITSESGIEEISQSVISNVDAIKSGATILVMIDTNTKTVLFSDPVVAIIDTAAFKIPNHIQHNYPEDAVYVASAVAWESFGGDSTVPIAVSLGEIILHDGEDRSMLHAFMVISTRTRKTRIEGSDDRYTATFTAEVVSLPRETVALLVSE